MEIVDVIKAKIRGTINLKQLKKDGLKIGKNFNAMYGTIIDPGHCWLIEIGDNVTFAPRVHILAHDASMKKSLGYTKIARVSIGNNVFLGAGTIVLPGVQIDDNTIVGAGSVVPRSLIGGGVYVGNPAKKICEYDEWIEKEQQSINSKIKYDETYKINNISEEKKKKMKKDLISDFGYCS